MDMSVLLEVPVLTRDEWSTVQTNSGAPSAVTDGENQMHVWYADSSAIPSSVSLIPLIAAQKLNEASEYYWLNAIQHLVPYTEVVKCIIPMGRGLS